MKTFLIKTLGCKVNQFESEVMASQLTAAGWEQRDKGPADLYIVNTCTVTGKGAGQSRQYLRHYRRENPQAVIIAAGCYASVGAEEIRAMGCVDAIIGHAAKYKIPDMAARLLYSGEMPPSLDKGDPREMFARFSSWPEVGSRARPVLKIQDGCNAFCTYCIVPYTRGRSVSMAPDQVLAAIRGIAAAGYPEVVLTGIHLGAYGMDLNPSQSLYQLLSLIDQTRAIDRIRLSSLEPRELTDEIIGLAARSRRICRHFHLPLQSGSDSVLARMTRPYTAAFFRNRVEKIMAVMPTAAVGVDVLVGFPGEGDDEFAETIALLNELPVSYLHVFPFSPRPGTPAADFADQVHPAVISERCRLLRCMGAAFRERFSRRQQGRTATIRIEGKRDRISGLLKGVTDNYLTVLIEGEEALKNTDVRVCIGDSLGGLRVRGRSVGWHENHSFADA